jgi:hypothetical protein
VADLYPNRDRTALLDDIATGRIYTSLGGYILWRAPNGRNNMRVGRRVRELVDACWAELGDGGIYKLTAEGERARAEGHRIRDAQRRTVQTA